MKKNKKSNRKLKYLLLLLIILLLNAGVIGFFTISRYSTSVNLKEIQDIGFTIFKLETYDLTEVEGYDSGIQRLVLAPSETKSVTYKLSNNVQNDNYENYYNGMELEAYIKVLDEQGNELTENSDVVVEQISGIEGMSYNTEKKAYGPITLDWTGETLDEEFFTVQLKCSENCNEVKEFKYYVKVEAFNAAAEVDQDDKNKGVIVRRSEELPMKTYAEYTIEYELNNTDNEAIWKDEAEVPVNYILGETINLVEPVSRTQDFDGWYEDEDFSGTKITDKYEKGNRNLKFYAKWKDKTDMHKLTVTSLTSGVTINYKSDEEYVGLDETLTNSNGFNENFSKDTKINVKVSKEGYEPVEFEVTMGDTDILKQVQLRKLYSFSLTGVTDADEDADIEYSVNVPANSSYIPAKSESGTKTGTLTGSYTDGTYPEGTTINVTVKKDGCESVTKSYTVSDNITDTITIRRLYALNLTGVAYRNSAETNATITYTINVPASAYYAAQEISSTATGSLTGNYPKGTTVSVTVSKDEFDSESKSYTMSTSGITDKITVYVSHSYTLTVSNPAGANITFSINGTLISGSTTGTTTNTVRVREGDVVSYAARADGYYTKFDDITVNEDKSDTISLELIVPKYYNRDEEGNSSDNLILPIVSKSAIGTIDNIDNIASTSPKAKSLTYAVIHRKDSLVMTFKLPDEIPDNATINVIHYRHIVSNGGREVDYSVEVMNGENSLAYEKADASSSLGNTGKSHFDFNVGIKVADLSPSRTITIKVTDLETEKHNLNNQYLNFKGADVQWIYYTPGAE